jgi:cytidylate kinase
MWKGGVQFMYFITISELFGTNGDKIAQEVANSLNYTYYGEDELSKAADQMGFLTDVQKVDEKGPALLERFFSEKPRVYLDRLQSVIFEVAKKGDAIFFGKGSQLLLNSFSCALHVLVTGSTEKRIERIVRERGVGREIAEKMIERTDHDKKAYFRFAFNEDWLNPHLYDLILNTDKLSIESAAKMVLDAANSGEIKACGMDSVKLLGKLSLHRKVESALLEAGVTNQYLFFDVEDKDSVRVYGLAHSPEEKENIEKILKGIKDIKKVINELGLSKGYIGGI